MKKITLTGTTLMVVFFTACNSGNDGPSKPKPGVLIGTAEMPATGDASNHFTFSIKVFADSNGKQGVYTVDAHSGPYGLASQFTMPKNGESLEPVIRKGTTPNTFIIGFKMPDDTAFYDYFEVNSNRDTIKMKYIKAYSLQQ